MKLSKRMKLYAAGMVLIPVIVINILLLQYANTLVWPYLWPRPGIHIIVAIFIVLFWLPELTKGVWQFRIVGMLMIFIGQCYVVHSILVMFAAPSIIAVIHVIGITGTFLTMTLGFINQLRPRSNYQSPPLPDELPYVAAVIPTYGEPVDILENTVQSLKGLDYPAERLLIMISDDGHRPEVQAMADRQGISYNFGARKDAKAGNLNSAIQYLKTNWPQAELILTQDADEIIDRSYLQKIVGYFTNPRIGFVQTPKDALAPKGDPFGVRDRVFYDVIQSGRNGTGAAFSCGSGVLWRIAAIESIGGFVTWNVVEDLTTSFYLHAKGWRSEYHNEILSMGLAPDDIPSLLKQRGTWAVDTWRLFLFRNPLTVPGLTLSQRLQYFELGMFYITSAFLMPLLMITPILSLLSGKFLPIEGSALFPWVIVSIGYYMLLSGSQGEFFIRMYQYWVGHFATNLKAFWIAVRSRNKKPSYKVTSKTRQNGFHGRLVWVQFAYIVIGAIAVFNGLFALNEISFMVRLANIAVVLFFMFMVSAITNAAFYGVSFPRIKSPFHIRRRLGSFNTASIQEGSGTD